MAHEKCIHLPGTDERVRMFLNEQLLAECEMSVYNQARNTLATPGVEHVCLLPDTHFGYGAPIGSVVVATNRVIPGPVGYDIGCGMALYLTNVKAEVIKDRIKRRALMDSIDRGIAMGEGKQATHGVKLGDEFVMDCLNKGAHALAGRHLIPKDWPSRCERAIHEMPDRKPFTMEEIPHNAFRGFKQLGTLGGGK